MSGGGKLAMSGGGKLFLIVDNFFVIQKKCFTFAPLYLVVLNEV